MKRAALWITAVAACTVVVGISGTTIAPAASWEPTEEVKLIIHTAPGGDTDIFVRQIEKHFDKMLPAGANAVNMPGAGGDRARRYVLEQQGNPHVLGAITPSNINNPILHNADYSSEDFTPVAIMVVSPLLIAVNAESEYETFEELIQAARDNPGKIVQGGGDVGEVDSLYHSMLSEAAGVDMTFTPFKSKGIIELLGEHVDFVAANPAQIDRYVDSGNFRVLASNVRVEAYPDVPTFEEAGYQFPILKQYRGFWMPDGVSMEARDYYIAQLKEILKKSDFKEYVAKNDLVVQFVAGNELVELLRREEEAYRKLDKELGLLKD